MSESYEQAVSEPAKFPDTIKPDVLEPMEYQYQSKREILSSPSGSRSIHLSAP